MFGVTGVIQGCSQFKYIRVNHNLSNNFFHCSQESVLRFTHPDAETSEIMVLNAGSLLSPSVQCYIVLISFVRNPAIEIEKKRLVAKQRKFLLTAFSLVYSSTTVCSHVVRTREAGTLSR